MYFFGLETGAYDRTPHVVRVVVNGIHKVELLATSERIPCNEQYHQSFAMPLNANDQVTVYLVSGTLYADYVYYQTGFVILLYSPIHGVNVIWSVHKTTSATGPTDPLPFEYVMANEGNAWNSVGQQLCVPASGIYYLHLNAAVAARQMVNMQLLVNGVPLMDIRRDTTHHSGTETRGRALMNHLNQGDKMTVILLNGTSVYSDQYLQTSFSGFLLYPD